MNAILMLEDGSSFEGQSQGVPGERIAEVVLNTAVVGYQELMTDTTNAGKILVMTYPLIGNYGVGSKFYESDRCRVSGLVIKETSRIYSNWQAEGSFDSFLKKENVVAISGVDTRTLAVTIRDKGQMLGIIRTGKSSKADLAKRLKNHKKTFKADLIRDMSVKKAVEIRTSHLGPAITVLDIGSSNSFINKLKTLGCRLRIVPYNTPADEVLAGRPDGVVILNGPEGDLSLKLVADTVRSLLGKVPILGVAAGHEVIALALKCRLKRMSIGHHGVNYPVKTADSYKGEITTQNHSYVVDDTSLKGKKGVRVTLRNLNDNTIEEMESVKMRLISAQYYPSSPGFGEPNALFVRFLKMVKGVRHAKA